MNIVVAMTRMLLLLQLLLVCLTPAAGFVAPRPSRRLAVAGTTSTTPTTATSTTTQLHGLLGRLRNKRKVEQVATIAPGAALPAVDVERLIAGAGGGGGEAESISEAVSIQDVLGTTKAILVGACRAAPLG